ncbi:chemotaxis response regulator protein-glutamate methylesterase [Aquisalimonas sp. 2447]|uniref:protein-glutamate methylesterase/protein-glutamine glutaminase n=1 Tax=Aquisalimonas sp. 2447 TaxID=2740807 RepID=UPI0014326E17|nr:chemotaxis response regulator protein-glutamate methylesterase [Aquisalimonas sp. 2447]QIT55685.1 chemotaxis response regulator protein-glutamate methylesterase [Aquisalimonas sp. 2447]
MAKRVLIVDDSGFFRRRIKEMLSSDPRLEVVGEAADGRQAVEEAVRLKPDVITMDIEMPVLDGISAVREIMQRQPTPVLMFSSLTFDGARATLDALEAGAVDFLPKRFSDISSNADKAREQLQERVRTVAAGARPGAATSRTRPTPPPTATRSSTAAGAATRESAAPARRASAGPSASDLDLVVIGASTGGPVALQRVLSALPASFPLPILLVQHMPANFTAAFAQRVDGMSKLRVREAVDGDTLEAGTALLAPGGQHMGVRRRGSALSVRAIEPRDGEFYKPSVDVALREATQACGGRVLGVILTGMGADGCEGARELKGRQGHVWSQDEATSVIYGMPGAVAKAGLTDREMPLTDIGQALARLA